MSAAMLLSPAFRCSTQVFDKTSIAVIVNKTSPVGVDSVSPVFNVNEPATFAFVELYCIVSSLTDIEESEFNFLNRILNAPFDIGRLALNVCVKSSTS